MMDRKVALQLACSEGIRLDLIEVYDRMNQVLVAQRKCHDEFARFEAALEILLFDEIERLDKLG